MPPKSSPKPKRLAPRAQIILYADLLARARLAKPHERRHDALHRPNRQRCALAPGHRSGTPRLAEAARFVRRHAFAAIFHAGSGHPGGALSSADLLACLYGAEMNVWPGGSP